ncbi:MAG TPA: ABC transporter permease [Beutenbergiaceae bacterium]|nr:ABC transporter permease [Beutenbergiaceae bacterium]
MNHTLHAAGLGLHRGWAEFGLALRSIQDQAFYLIMAAAVVGYLWINRDNPIEGTDLLLPQFAMPGILGGMIAFTLILGPAGQLAQEREDGTLLRMRAIPRGITAYYVGQMLQHILTVLPMLLVILIPSALIFDGIMPTTARGWFTIVWVLVLGMLATLPIGMVLGSLMPSPQKVIVWGMLPTGALIGISGLLLPIQQLWTWVQHIAQVFPMYWLGLGMRSAFLPDDVAGVLEIAGTWRTWQTVAVLAAWTIVGTLITPAVLRRMTRRQSGSTVAAAREAAATQGVR